MAHEILRWLRDWASAKNGVVPQPSTSPHVRSWFIADRGFGAIPIGVALQAVGYLRFRAWLFKRTNIALNAAGRSA